MLVANAVSGLGLYDAHGRPAPHMRYAGEEAPPGNRAELHLMRWAIRPLRARLLRRREPSKFYLLWFKVEK